MSKYYSMKTSKTVSGKAGLSPGLLMHIGEQKSDTVRITAIDYSKNNYAEYECKTPEESFAFRDTDSVSWINIDGLHDTDTIAAIGEHFDLHPLLLEDVLNTRHRPKVEEFDEHLFVTLKMIDLSKDRKTILSEQVSMVLGHGWLITFQEREGDVFDIIRTRLKDTKTNLRNRGVDYLLYRLIDTIVDNYFIIIENITDTIEELEESVLEGDDDDIPHRIQRLKKKLINLRKAVSPLREAVSTLEKDASNLFDEGTYRYLRDVYEHIIQIMDIIEVQRDSLSNIMDLYLSGISNRMNQVMKVLTIIATIFIPLTFVAGIYGMNFQYMPELAWKYGYAGVWGIIIVIFIAMLFYFKKKKWL